MPADHHQNVPLERAITYVLEEARMLLPGIQALFGFQLIVVFNQTFSSSLSPSEQTLHLAAIGLVALAAALIMAPAAYHRLVDPDSISRSFLQTATRLLTAGMPPLLFGITIDFYLIARLVLHRRSLAAGVAAGLLIIISMLWFGYPLLCRTRRHRRR